MDEVAYSLTLPTISSKEVKLFVKIFSVSFGGGFIWCEKKGFLK